MSPTGPRPGGGSGASSAGKDAIPATIGRYAVVRLLGKGAQGAVYLASDPNLAIDVAIKVLHPDFRSDEFLDRFKVEARTAVRLTAPNIVRVYDFDLDYPYLVMEYCGDGDLNRLIKSRRRLSLAEILSITRQIAEALVAAHEHEPSILHRDLKPGNVLFQKTVPKVADFGLAKMLGGGSGLTTTRGVMGTVRYCSPEQLRDASSVGHRADLWSLGVILYELLTWRRPFDKPGDEFVNIAIRVRTEPMLEPPYEVPEPVMTVVRRSLEKMPNDRYGSARELIADIDRALRSVPGADRLALPPEELVGEVDRMAAEVTALLGAGRSQDAASLIQQMRRRSPEDSLGRFWEHRLKERRQEEDISSSDRSIGSADRERIEWIERQFSSVQSFLQSRNYRSARLKIGEILIQDPDNTIAQRWLEKVNAEERKLRQDLEQAHKDADLARTADDPRKVYEAWKRLGDLYPDLQEIQAELAVATRELGVREAKLAHEAAAKEAGRLVSAGDQDGALAVWRTHLAGHPHDREAEQESQRIQQEIAARERERRLERLRTDAVARQNAGDLEGALSVWGACLLEDPSSLEAAREATRLRGEIARRDREKGRQEAGMRAESCAAAGDLGGALSAWQGFVRAYPDDRDARAEVERLGREREARERAALADGLETLVARVTERSAAKRYDGLPEARRSLESVARTAAAAVDKESRELGAALDALRDALRSAEESLSRELARRRVDLEARVRQTREWLPRAALAERRDDAEDRLDGALRAAVAALCETWPAGSTGDPIAVIAAAANGLAEAAAALARGRGQSVEESRTRVRTALAAARGEIDDLAVVAGGPPGGSEIDLEAFVGSLRTLEAASESQIPERLDQVARETSRLRTRAVSERLATLWKLTGMAAVHLEAARAIAPRVRDGHLEETIRRGARLLESQDGDAPVAAGEISSLVQDLEAAIGTARASLAERIAGSRQRWERAAEAWRSLLESDLGSAMRTLGERILSAGEGALTERHPEDLDKLAGQLEGLARRFQMESVWIEQSDAVLQLEGPVGTDGVPVAEPATSVAEILVRYRMAAARGDGAALRALGPDLERRRERQDSARDGIATSALAAPLEMGVRVRRFNEKLNAAALNAFDAEVDRYRKSIAQGRKGEAARLAGDVRRAHRRLLEPPPMWRRLAAPAAALLILVVGAGILLWGRGAGPGTFRVAVVSPAGDIDVASVLRSGSPVAGLALSVPEAGLVWSLEPGRYTVRTKDGATTEFDVPAQRSVLLPSSGTLYSAGLLKELTAEVGSP